MPLYCWLKELDAAGTGSPSLNPEVTDGTDRSKVGGDCNPDDPNPLELGKPKLQIVYFGCYSYCQTETNSVVFLCF